MRQIATSRYSFGFWGAKLCSVLNIVVGGGFAVVNYVVVGQILSAVSNYTMSITVGIVIIAVISYVVSIFGFKLIHTFEKYSWIYTFILLCVLIGQAAPHVQTNLAGEDGSSGVEFSGTFLTIVAINFCKSLNLIPSSMSRLIITSQRIGMVFYRCRLLLQLSRQHSYLEDLLPHVLGYRNSDHFFRHYRMLPRKRCNYCCLSPLRRCIQQAWPRWPY